MALIEDFENLAKDYLNSPDSKSGDNGDTYVQNSKDESSDSSESIDVIVNGLSDNCNAIGKPGEDIVEIVSEGDIIIDSTLIEIDEPPLDGICPGNAVLDGIFSEGDMTDFPEDSEISYIANPDITFDTTNEKLTDISK